RKLRIAFYSHDTMGLGHIRRNLLLARTLAESPLQPNILLITGTNVATSFAMPPGVDVLALPGLGKDVDGRYKSRSLHLTLREIVSIREKTICAALETFCPDVLIVDNVPRGTNCELDLALEFLRSRGQTRFVLGLRDILDEPAAVQREWKRRQNEKIILDYYNAVWIYGDRKVFDPIREYQFSKALEEKMRFTGYLDRRLPRPPEKPAGSSKPKRASDPFILCMAGGGQDGAVLLEAFAKASLPNNACGVVLTGSYLPYATRKMLHTQAGINPKLKILDFHPEPTQLLRDAQAVVAMGGYNTVSEILSFKKQALIVPRVVPRREQMIRAERLKELGLLDICHPDKVTPRAITEWVRHTQAQPIPQRGPIDLNGLNRIPSLVEEVVARGCQFGKISRNSYDYENLRAPLAS
ncbi:MAG: glycosyltransferase family protein, partial [Nitrospinales bacterium]